jgi:hypothetical protein
MPPQQNEFQAWASRLGQTSGVPATRQPYQPNWQYGGGQPQGQLPAPGPIDVESRVIPGPNWQPGAFAKQAMGGKPMGQLSGPPTPKDLVQGTRGMPGGKPDFLGFSNKVPSAGAAP